MLSSDFSNHFITENTHGEAILIEMIHREYMMAKFNFNFCIICKEFRIYIKIRGYELNGCQICMLGYKIIRIRVDFLPKHSKMLGA